MLPICFKLSNTYGISACSVSSGWGDSRIGSTYLQEGEGSPNDSVYAPMTVMKEALKQAVDGDLKCRSKTVKGLKLMARKRRPLWKSLGFFRKNFGIDSRSLLMGTHFWSGNGSTFKWTGREGNREMRRVVWMKKSTRHDSIYPGTTLNFFSRHRSHYFVSQGHCCAATSGIFDYFPKLVGYPGNIEHTSPCFKCGTQNPFPKYTSLFASFPPIFVSFGNPPSHVPRGGTEGGNGKYLEILF